MGWHRHRRLPQRAYVYMSYTDSAARNTLTPGSRTGTPQGTQAELSTRENFYSMKKWHLYPDCQSGSRCQRMSRLVAPCPVFIEYTNQLLRFKPLESVSHNGQCYLLASSCLAVSVSQKCVSRARPLGPCAQKPPGHLLQPYSRPSSPSTRSVSRCPVSLFWFPR